MGTLTEIVIKARQSGHDPYRPADVPDSFAKPAMRSAAKISGPAVQDMAAAPSVQDPMQFSDPTPAPAAPPAGPGLRSPPRQHPWVPDNYQPPRPTFPSSQVPVPQSVIDGASRAWDATTDFFSGVGERIEDLGERIGRSLPARPSTQSAPTERQRQSTPGLNIGSISRDANRAINDLLGGRARVDENGMEVRGQNSSAAPLAPGYNNRGESARVPLPPAQPLNPQTLDDIISRMEGTTAPQVHAPATPAPQPQPRRPSVSAQPSSFTPGDPEPMSGMYGNEPDGFTDEGWSRPAIHRWKNSR